MVCCVRMATSCKTFWSKRVLQRWMHSLVLPCLSCKCWTRNMNDSNGKIHLRVSRLPWHQGTAGTESLESFGSFGCARGGSFVLGSGNVKTTVWSMALGFGFLIALQLFSRTQPLQALVVGWSFRRKAAEQRGQFLSSQCSNTNSAKQIDAQSGWCESG